MKKVWKFLLYAVIAGLVVVSGGAIFAVYCNYVVKNCGKFCYDDTAQVPEYDTALLLGTARISIDGYPNLYYFNRVRVAAELFKAGKIKRILISGDNGRKDYSEPEDMKNDLLKLGIPETAMILDYAGFRTLDSVVRAKNVFNVRKMVIISQEYHLPRAVYIARKHGVDAIGFIAPEQNDLEWLRKKNHARERLARIAAWLDVNIFRRQPKFVK